jgi:MYXO-CTERM domain-containing protein
MTAADCDDHDACTTDSCDAATGVCTNAPIAGCCQLSGDCDDHDNCTLDFCLPMNHTCVHFPAPGCCLSDADCQDNQPCTRDECDLATNTCTHFPITGCCTSQADCVDPSRCELDTCNVATHTCAITPLPNCCRSGADCDDGNACTTDSCDVASGRCSNTQIAGCCMAGGDCDDHDACTADSCDLQTHTCMNVPVAGCCRTDADCDDNDQCTQDMCDAMTHECTHSPVVGCCHRDSDCVDMSVCTDDRCDDNTHMCTHTPKPGCCVTASDCDDNNSCTMDSCDVASQTCMHVSTCGSDAGPGGVDLTGGGCSCDTRGRAPGGALLLAAVVAFALRRRRRLALALALVAGSAHAGGFDAELYQQTTSPSGYLTQESADVIPQRDLDVGVAFDFVHDPLVARDPATGDPLMNGEIISNRLALQLTAGYGVARWLEVGAALPVVVAQGGDVTLVDPGHSLSTSAFGDLRLFGKAQLWTRDELRLATALDVTLPSGDSDSFSGGKLSVRPRMIFGWRPGRLSAAADVGFRFREATMVDNVTVGSEVTLGAAAAYELRPAKLWAIAEALLAVGVDGGAHEVPAEALLGVRAMVTKSWRGQVAVGEGLGRGYDTPAFQAIASMAYTYAPAPRVRPEPVRDTDHDGIPDDVDKCPLEPEDKDGFQDEDGCPDLDNDGDGIADAQDACPNEAEDHDGFQDQDGCPDLDNDGDAIPDVKDMCPNEPEDKDGYQDQDGCPDPDNDSDGIPDPKDACPDQAEVKNGYQDEDGCPDEIPDKLKKFVGVVEGINFKLGSNELLPSSRKRLDAAVETLKEFPDLRLEIQGHTDDQPVRPGGKFASNEELSQARADAVRSYLLMMGIVGTRLTAQGYGSTQPLQDPAHLTGGKLAAARAKNRRVQFVIMVAP